MPQEESGELSINQPLIALGSNEQQLFGGAKAIITQAISELGAAGMAVVAQSRLFATPCFPAGSGPDFVNAVVQVETRLAPDELLARLHGLEAKFRRMREKRWAPRTLDLDILAFGNAIVPDRAVLQHWLELPFERQMHEAPDHLIVPHPRLQDRAFVLIPMADIAPDWRHPLIQKTVAEMIKALPEAEKAAILPIQPD